MSEEEKVMGRTVDATGSLPSASSGRPERVRCIDAWDTFKNLVVGKVYDVAKMTEGGSIIWVIGERGFCGGWSKWCFESVIDRPAQEPGGCDCHNCGRVFIGEPWHTLCAECALSDGPKGQGNDGDAVPGTTP